MARRLIWCLLLVLLGFASFLVAAEETIRVDRYGDLLPEHALARLGTVRFRQGTSLRCLAYSPDGKFLASGGTDNEVVVWDCKNGRRIHVFREHPGWVRALAFSPDSKRCVSTSFRGGGLAGTDFCLWNVATGKVLWRNQPKDEATRSVAFAPDGKIIASIHGRKHIGLWDVQTGKPLPFLDCSMETTAFAFAPNSKTVAVAGSCGTIQIWDLQTRILVRKEQPPGVDLRSIAFSPDGTILAVAGAGGLGERGSCIRLFQVSNLEKIADLKGHQGTAYALAFSPDGKTLVSGGQDRTIRVWDVPKAKQIGILPKQENEIDILVVSPDGKTSASASFSNSLVQFWDLQTGEALHKQEGLPDEVDQIAFLSDGEKLASRGVRSQCVVWPHLSGDKALPLRLPEGSENGLLVSNRSSVAVATKKGVLVLVDLLSERELVRCPTGKNIRVVAVSVDNKRAVVRVGSEKIEVWDLPTTKAIRRFPDARCLALSLDGRLLALEINSDVVVWDLDTQNIVCYCEVPGGGINSLAFSPDGRMLAIGGGYRTIRVWEIATGKHRVQFQGYSDRVNALTYSRDGRLLASGGADTTVRVWDVQTGKCLQVFQGHLGLVTSVDFSPNSRRLVSGSQDTSALIWEIPAVCLAIKKPVVQLGARERNQLWAKLGDMEVDAATAYAAQQVLAAAPMEAVSLCRERLLHPSTSPEQIRGWIAQLDDEEYAVREQASSNLENSEAEAKNLLEKTLKGDCSPEVRRRIELLLEKPNKKTNSGLLVSRGVELLEQIGTAEAVDVLRQLEKKTADAVVRDDVRRSLDRLAAKQKAP